MSRDWLKLAVVLVVGVLIGWFAAAASRGGRLAAPADWLARVGTDYITPAMFIDEMHRRGGKTPGQYQDAVQKRALLDDMVLRRAIVQAAEADALPDDPAVRAQLDQVLVNQYLRRTLRPLQEAVTVAEADVRAHYDAHAADYIVPARRRVAMVQILVPKGAGEDVWANAMARGAEALAKARQQGSAVPHFGAVAREYSQDQASRYRGGMIGWISEGQRDRYRYDPVVLDAALAAKQAGDFSEVLRGQDGVYLVRVVDIEAQRERQFEQLATGIHQRLLQDRQKQAEQTFREQLLARTRVSVRAEGLDRIDPLAPPAQDQPPQPPAMPTQ
jgi:parvulin-like peptidyl-prolyl isomerase